MKMPYYPKPGGDGIADTLIVQAGGSAANTAIVLSRLGIGTQLIARIGRDSWGELALRTLREAGVGLDELQVDEREPTGLNVTPVTPDGERTMLTYRGANAHIDPDLVRPEGVAGSQFLHVSSYAFLESPQREAAWKAIGLARQSGTRISLDVAVEPANWLRGEKIDDLLRSLDLMVLSEQEARVISGQEDRTSAVGFLLERGVRLVALKLGGEGCQLWKGKESVVVPGFPVKGVDTTGAGDSFGAGMLFGELAGLSLPAAGTLANALGALAASRWGAGSSLPGSAETAAFLAEHADPRGWSQAAREALADFAGA